MKKTYIVILNYCGAKDTILCLESIFKVFYTNYHIILVDNCSPDNSVDTILEWAEGRLLVEENNERYKSLIKPFVQKPIFYKIFNENDLLMINDQELSYSLTIIKAKSNRGFSAGNNIGLRYAIHQEDANYFWLINNDTIVTPDSLRELIKCYHGYAEEEKVGIVGGKLLYYSEPDKVQCLGGGIYNKFLGIVREVGGYTDNDLENNINVGQLDYISGACMLVNPDFIKEVGLLSEDYFFYYEELDWCTRGFRKGWNIKYTNKASIYHKVGATVNAKQKGKEKSLASDYYSVRSKLLYASKYNGVIVNIIIRIALLGTIFNRIRRRQFNRIPMIMKLIFTSY